MLKIVSFQLCSSLRSSTRSARPINHSALQQWRTISSTPTTSLLRNVAQLHRRPPNFSPSLHPARHISLGSIFSRSTTVPSPTVVAHITRLEAEANVYPHDVSKQLAFFEALRDTKLKSSYELIISRWERMCEFDPTSPLLQSPQAFQIYLASLVNTGQQASVSAAVRRRDSLLSSLELSKNPSETSSEPSTSDVVSESKTPEQANSLPENASLQKPGLTPSQEIAQNVLSGQAASSTRTNTSSNPFLNSSSTSNDGGPIQVTIVERKGAWIPRLVRFLALTLVASFFFLIILSVFFENTGFMKNGPRQSQFEPSEGKVVKFSDVHGVDEVKEELQDIVAFLKDPSAFATLGGKLPKGVLLTGPPGTGKTMLARAVAGEAGVPFFFASGSDFEEMFVGVGAKRVRELFAAARKKEPAIIFIDELDAVGGRRSSRDQQYMKQTLNQLLVEMDGFQQTEGVIVMAATNFPESLDPALVRPGRFDRHIAVPLPDIRGRMQILQHHMKNVTTSKDVDAKVLARGTSGFSGADLQNMVNQAAVRAAKEHAKEVNLSHFEWARDRILMGAERKSAAIDEKAKLATAYHEGGHALVALYTDGAIPLHKVTCVPRGHALGYTSFLPENDRFSVSLKEYLASIDVSMGGRVAEELIYGPQAVTSGASSDIRKATHTARMMVKQWGFSKLGPIYYDDSADLSPRRKDEIEDEVTKIIKESENRTTVLLKSRIEELHRLARALVEHETLDKDEVAKVVKGEPIRNITEVLETELSSSSDS
ncbi:intermembrane space aaa protease iap-1 [Moniliophthora roreri MCA 2997]|uniref:Intermembrane space aaa protease iap-1 n=1 Tax=Moniliophthora roreri (strain MCA 2997) TaxID=1381753 RepID=V2XWL0_MONRO|nr:intermembrane space aaa protease iap-1 [Moniliophthora roreri MCA 2997]